MESKRPNPDELLQSLKEVEAREKRACLKIFFGAAPGVGKTFAMLQEARERRTEGVDVVAGVIETHGRADTEALAEGFEVLPRKVLPYRGTHLEEFDLEAALARHPALILMDELAHSNTQGSLHAKRWQDVWDILDAGIDVYTTVNVQHLESLKDVVAQITGIIVRENIPDTILKRADQIELVDIPAEELQERLKEGKVYVPELARHATDRFFRKGNLLALRELALRRTADHVDEDMRRYMASQKIGKTWAAGERLLVVIGSHPGSDKLLRATKRMADSLSAPWIALVVETSRSLRYSEEERARVEEFLRLAERLGGETVIIPGDVSPGEDILALATSRNVSKIIIGKPRRSRWMECLTGSLMDQLARQGGDIDIHIIGGDSGGKGKPLPLKRGGRVTPLPHFAYSALMVGFVTVLAILMRHLHFELADITMLYVLGILVAATRFGRWPAVFASMLSVLTYDYFLIHPLYSLGISDLKHVGTFLVLLVMGLVIGNLGERIRSQTRLARVREQRTLALFRLSGELTKGGGSASMLESAIRSVAAQFGSRVSILLPDAHGRLAQREEGGGIALVPAELAVAQWVHDHHESAGLGTETLPGAKALYLPLSGGQGLIGVMGIEPDGAAPWLEPDERHLLESFANQTALALERALLAERTHADRQHVNREHLRNALLSSVSQDLKSPLGDILGAADQLLGGPLDEASRQDLAEHIREEAGALQHLVTNLVDATRLESGVLEVTKEWMPASDLVASALDRMDGRLASREVQVDLPANLPLVLADPVLMEQVLLNILDNAHKFAPKGTPIQIRGWATERAVTLAILDQGPGIPEGEEDRIFEKLVRIPQEGGRVGAGLGLAICKGIVEAHGGTIQGSSRAPGGAQFLVSLPLENRRSALPSEE